MPSGPLDLRQFPALPSLIVTLLFCVGICGTNGLAAQNRPGSRVAAAGSDTGTAAETGADGGAVDEDVGDEEPGDDDLGDDDLGDEDLEVFQDLPVVVTASRTATPRRRTPVPTSVVTADDIHYGGWLSVPDALLFAPGLDVIRFDRRRQALGVRGLHESYSDRSLTLINGRRAVSVAFGGPEYHRLPLLMGDIEQIEIVRGPGGAAWGADALNGVVNIITKDPEDVLGVRLATTVTEFGDSYTHGRWAGVQDELSWRLSVGYQDHVSSIDALDLDPAGAEDDWSMLTVDSELRYRIASDMTLSGGVGVSDQDSASFPLFSYDPRIDQETETVRSFVRLDQKLDGTDSWFAQAYWNRGRTEAPTFTEHMAEDEVVLETQANLRLSEEHHLTFGSDARYRGWGLESGNPLQIETRQRRYDEATIGLFAVEQWHASSRALFELQLRADYLTEGDFDWSGRLTGVYSHDAQHTQVSRLSLARAYRVLTVFGEMTMRRGAPSGPYTYILDSAEGIENENLWSLEAGHSMDLSRELRLEANAYYQVYRDLVGIRELSTGVPARDRFANVGDGHASGVEIEGSYQAANWSVRAWYAHHHFDLDDEGALPRSLKPSRNKFGLIGRWQPCKDLTLQTAWKYAGELRDTNLQVVDDWFRVDLSLTKRFEGVGELQVGVWDVFDEMGEIVTSQAATETPGRTFYVRMSIDF